MHPSRMDPSPPSLELPCIASSSSLSCSARLGPSAQEAQQGWRAGHA